MIVRLDGLIYNPKKKLDIRLRWDFSWCYIRGSEKGGGIMASCDVGTKVSYFVAGLGIGAAIALLFAPQSGEETRKQIAEKAQDGKDLCRRQGPRNSQTGGRSG